MLGMRERVEVKGQPLTQRKEHIKSINIRFDL